MESILMQLHNKHVDMTGQWDWPIIEVLRWRQELIGEVHAVFEVNYMTSKQINGP